MLPRPGQQALGDFGKWPLAVRDEQLLGPRQPELVILRVEHFEQAIGYERQQIAGLPIDGLRLERRVGEHADGLLRLRDRFHL